MTSYLLTPLNCIDCNGQLLFSEWLVEASLTYQLAFIQLGLITLNSAARAHTACQLPDSHCQRRPATQALLKRRPASSVCCCVILTLARTSRVSMLSSPLGRDEKLLFHVQTLKTQI